MTHRNWTSYHLFCGGGGDALGFQNAGIKVIGGLDADPKATADFEYLTGVPALTGDITEMVPDDIRDQCDGVRPDILITSPPCKGNSGCLPAAQAETEHYQELNSLSQLGIWMMLEAWPDNPPPLVLLENVERITSRSRDWLDQTIEMLRAYGYAVQESTHDCGELGGLAQHRRRYLLVARQMDQIPNPLYEPSPKRVKGIGEVIGSLPVPVPDCPEGGEMHTLPRLSAMNWLRLASIPAGKDWRALPEEIGVCDGYRGRYGVSGWTATAKTIRANHEVRLAPASVVDPRIGCAPRNTAYGVTRWTDSSGVVLAHACHDNSAVSIADPRVSTRSGKQNGGYGTNDWREPAHTVLGEGSIQNTWASVTDPRVTRSGEKLCDRRDGSMGVKRWDEASTPIIANGRIHNHPCSVVDPRIDYAPRSDSYGVASMDETAKTIRAVQRHTNGQSSVADDRLAEATHLLHCDGQRLTLFGPDLDLESYQSADPVPVIMAPDGTWHRPMTTLELAALQGFPVRHRGEWLRFTGNNNSDWRERIGNAIPPPTAEAIGRQCIATLEAAADGGMWMQPGTVWVDEQRAAQ